MLYIIRHGKTEWNVRRKIQGRTDVPLNEEGREMARAAALEYADVHFDVCYCSPLLRARETAELLLDGRDVPIIYDDRLQEMCFGIYEGFEASFDHPDCPVNVIFKEPEKYDFEIEGAESWDDLFGRTGDFLNSVALPLVDEGKDVLIVGHGAMNLSLTCQIKNKPIEEFWSDSIENCKLKRLI